LAKNFQLKPYGKYVEN